MPSRKIMKKICLLGDGAVGKTTLIKKFVYDKFDDKYIMTFGTKVTKKGVCLSAGGQDFDLTMMIWDILGQRVHDALHATYYQGAAGALLVCDVTRRETLQGLEEWARVFRNVCPETPIIFLGNKSDLKDQARVTDADLAALAARYGTVHFMTSAKTGEHVEESFLRLGRTIIEGMLGREV
jgi:small GTP-binding protein